MNNIEKLKSYRAFRVPIREKDKIGFQVSYRQSGGDITHLTDLKLKNISLTGFAFFTNTEIEEDGIIDVFLNFKGHEYQAYGRVVRCAPQYNQYGEKEKFFVAIEYTGNSSSITKEFLTKFISSFSTKRLKEHLVSLLINESDVKNYDEQQRTHLSLSLFGDMSRFAKIDSFLKTLFNETIRRTYCQKASLYFFNEEYDYLTLYDWERGKLSPYNFSVQNSIICDVVLKGRCLALNSQDQCESDPFFEFQNQVFGGEVINVLMVPLKNFQGKIIGVIEFQNKEEIQFNRKDLELVNLLSLITSRLFGEAVNINGLDRVNLEKEDFESYKIIGTGIEFEKLMDFVNNNKENSENIILYGGQGAGKSHIAKFIHQESDKSNMNLGEIRCEELNNQYILKKSLLGDEESVGQLELYGGGVIILHDITHFNIEEQKVLLELCQSREDIRFISTSDIDIKILVEKGEFLEELYNFLGKKTFEVIPLCERKEDIPLLAQFFLDKLSYEKGLCNKKLSRKVIDKLMQYDWPGNNEELQLAMARIVLYFPYHHYIENIENDVVPIFDDRLNQAIIYKDIIQEKSTLNRQDQSFVEAIFKGRYIEKMAQTLDLDIEQIFSKLNMTLEEGEQIMMDYKDLRSTLDIKLAS